jgi:hypothetical protein
MPRSEIGSHKGFLLYTNYNKGDKDDKEARSDKVNTD